MQYKLSLRQIFAKYHFLTVHYYVIFSEILICSTNIKWHNKALARIGGAIRPKLVFCQYSSLDHDRCTFGQKNKGIIPLPLHAASMQTKQRSPSWRQWPPRPLLQGDKHELSPLEVKSRRRTWNTQCKLNLTF